MKRILPLIVIVLLVLIAILGYRISNEVPSLTAPGLEAPKAPKTNFQSWIDFINKDFKVRLPTLPQHASEILPDKNTGENRAYNMYVSEKPDGTIFMISLITFTKEPPQENKQTLMRTIMNDVVNSNPNNQLLKVEPGTYKGLDSLDYSIENPEIIIDAKTFMAGNTLYVLSRIAKKPDINSNEFGYFINSFNLEQQKLEKKNG